MHRPGLLPGAPQQICASGSSSGEDLGIAGWHSGNGVQTSGRGDGARDHEQPERRYRCKRLVAWSTGAAKAPSRIYHNGSLESLMLSFTNYSGLPRFRVTAHSRPTVKIHSSQIRANLFSDFSCTYKD